MSSIESHTLLANGYAAALLTPHGRITWLCLPRPDSPSVLGELLGGAGAGYLSVAPAGPAPEPSQTYRPGTLIAETSWPGLTVTDWLAEESTADGGRLLRRLAGQVRVRVEFAPRPGYGLTAAGLHPVPGGLAVSGAGLELTLRATGNAGWSIADGPVASVELDLAQLGGFATVELAWGHRAASATTAAVDADGELAATESAWTSWTAALSAPRTAYEATLRSALTLRGLVYRPTGAILAAPTTSLPEVIGGMRNWDYRFCWLRDASMTARALVDLGSLAEAQALLSFLAGCVERTGGNPENLAPLYTLDGLTLGPELELAHLHGYEGSTPVRVGNGASTQLQLDVFGPVADLVDAVTATRGDITGAEWQTVVAMVSAIERRWRWPDHGPWEARMDPQHHVYSKVMCWQVCDSALRIAGRHGLRAPQSWPALREEIAADVTRNGWHDGAGAYTMAYGNPQLDAAALWIGLSGLLPADDPRFAATIAAVEAELRDGPAVYRYRWDDGMPGREGGFHICATWLVEAYALSGRVADAEALLDLVLGCAGATGLLPEQVDPRSGRGLGNHPQAYSHLGVIRAARALDAARSLARDAARPGRHAPETAHTE